MTNFSDDSLDDVFGAPTERTVTDRPAAVEYRAKVAENPTYFQKCPRCNGTGQTRWGVCFKCRGAKGQTFKTSPETRARNAHQTAARKQRVADEAWATFMAQEPAIGAWIEAKAASFDFAAKMQEAVVRFGDLTEGQRAAVERCIARDAAKAAERAERAQQAPEVDVSRIEAAFASARASAARPGQMGVWVKPLKLRAGTKEVGIDVTFKDGTPGTQWEGMLFIKNAEGKKLGFIKGGKFQKRFECTAEEAAAVLEVAADPAKAATTFGKAWSRCSICSRTLTKDESIDRAMGPKCAERFGWG